MFHMVTLCLTFFKRFIYSLYFLAVVGLISLIVESRDYSLLWFMGFSLKWLLLLWSKGSRVQASVFELPRFSCSAACGIFPDQGSNQCPLHCKADP